MKYIYSLLLVFPFFFSCSNSPEGKILCGGNYKIEINDGGLYKMYFQTKADGTWCSCDGTWTWDEENEILELSKNDSRCTSLREKAGKYQWDSDKAAFKTPGGGLIDYGIDGECGTY